MKGLARREPFEKFRLTGAAKVCESPSCPAEPESKAVEVQADEKIMCHVLCLSVCLSFGLSVFRSIYLFI